MTTFSKNPLANQKNITMFAVLIINNIPTNAGRGLALTLQAFFMSAYIVVFRYWYSCTPVYRLNGRTAFVGECDKQRDRHGYLLFLLCVIFTNFPTLHCLAATERQPTKPAHKYSIRTHCVSTTPRANAVASLHSHRPCVSCSFIPSRLPIRTSAESRSTIPAYSLPHASGHMTAESFIRKLIPCRTSTDSSTKVSARYSHNPITRQLPILDCTPLRWGVRDLLYPNLINIYNYGTKISNV